MVGICDVCSEYVKSHCDGCCTYLCMLHNQKKYHALNCSNTKVHEKIKIYFTRKYWYFMHKYFHKYPAVPEGLGFDSIISQVE